jgi:predicted esterase
MRLLLPPLPPVAILHGSADDVIPVAFARAARDRLELAGADVLYREGPYGHRIDEEAARGLAPWLRSVLGQVAGGVSAGRRPR